MKRVLFIVGIFITVACLVAAGVDAFLKPFINPELGDVVLFGFILAGAVSGFIAGYGLRGLKAKN